MSCLAVAVVVLALYAVVVVVLFSAMVLEGIDREIDEWEEGDPR